MANLGTIGRAGGYTGGSNLRLNIATRQAGLPLGSELTFLAKDGVLVKVTKAKSTVQINRHGGR